jgi:vitamin B12 transporter
MFYRQKSYISFSVIAMLLQVSYASAQSGAISPDSTYHLDGVTVEATPITKVSTDQKIDSSALLLDNAIGIGGLLKYNSLIFIKDYGPGNITTVSARGGSASQSQVFWNGININQAGLGMTDLSTLPPFLLDHITVQQSTSGAASGSGSMAGNILLGSNASSNQGLYGLIKQSFSSIGEKSTGLRIGYRRDKFSIDARYIYINSDNTYRFINKAARPYEKAETQHNAGLIQQGYAATMTYKLSSRAELSVYSWYTHFDRNVAPTLQTILKAKQQDISFRNSVQFSYKYHRSRFGYKLAYLKDEYRYEQRTNSRDSIINADQGHTDNIINQIDYSFDLTNQLIVNAGITQFYQSISNHSFAEGGKSRHRFSFYGGIAWSSKRKHTVLTALFREELYATQSSPFIYSLQWDQCLLNNVSLLVKGERYYRIPTMNDLYWGKGGNPDLKPENGWGAEVGLVQVINYNKAKNTMTASVFTRSVKDWILWTPGGEYNYWMPQNVNEVWSRGIEFKNDFQLQFSKQTSLTFSFKHTYQNTTRQDPYGKNGEGYQKQLIYTPVYLGNVGVVIQHKQFALSYYQQYTSWVFIQTDERDYLDPYTYAMLRIQAGHTIGKNRLDGFFEIDNCWNASYQTVKDRPMPLRYYRAGVIYKWN